MITERFRKHYEHIVLVPKRWFFKTALFNRMHIYFYKSDKNTVTQYFIRIVQTINVFINKTLTFENYQQDINCTL